MSARIWAADAFTQIRRRTPKRYRGLLLLFLVAVVGWTLYSEQYAHYWRATYRAGHNLIFTPQRNLEREAYWATYVKEPAQPEPKWHASTLSTELNASFERPANRYARALLSRSLVGLAPGFVEREFERDKAEHGFDNHEKHASSGLSPHDAWNDVVFAHPDAEALAVHPEFLGRECASRYPLSECPFPFQCPPPVPGSPADQEKSELPCAWYFTGEPKPLRRWLDAGKRASTMRDELQDWDVPGTWINDLWHPYDPTHAHEPYHWFTPEEIYSCFVGKTILVQGDSMLRQFNARLIAYLRQIPTYVDWGSQTSTYQMYADGTDRWYGFCPQEPCDPKPRPHSEALFTLIFNWHEKDSPPKDIAFYNSLGADVVVEGWNYWMNGDFSFQPVLDELDKVWESKWDGGHGRTKDSLKFSWYMTPQRTEGAEGSEPAKEFVWRNTGMRRWVDEMRKKGFTNVNGLPMDFMTRSDNGKRIVRDRQPYYNWYGDVHFMAHYLEISFNEPIKPGLQFVKGPLDWDFRDMVDLNFVMVWLNGLCHPSS